MKNKMTKILVAFSLVTTVTTTQAFAQNADTGSITPIEAQANQLLNEARSNKDLQNLRLIELKALQAKLAEVKAGRAVHTLTGLASGAIAIFIGSKLFKHRGEIVSAFVKADGESIVALVVAGAGASAVIGFGKRIYKDGKYVITATTNISALEKAIAEVNQTLSTMKRNSDYLNDM